MNETDLNKNTVLVLNALYQAIGTISPKKALIAMNSISDGGYAAKAIDIIYPKFEDGRFDLENGVVGPAYTFEEWLMADFREGLDKAIHTSKMAVRLPTVIMTNYSKMPMRRFRATKTLLYELQKGVCGYSNKKLPMKQMNIEHKIPKSHGGRDTFENLMAVDAKINHARGNKPLEQLGLKPLFNHREPKPIPASYAIKTVVHPDWAHFISK
jgi:5-methylcytosine-specific restriction endonuclease McrA